MAAAHRARRWSFGGLVLVVTAGLVVAVFMSLVGSGASQAGAAAVAAQTWSDEFDGPAGRAPDSAKWTLENGGSGFGNHELQYYTTSTANAALDGQGHLVLTARKNTDAGLRCWYGQCQYTSARLNTAKTFTQTYGRFEARIKIPRGQGIWPAFWMLGNDLGTVGWPHSGEIDIMENIGREPQTVHGTVHGPGYSGAGGLGASYSLPGGRAFADDFHVFAVDWSPNSITWSVDGTPYKTLAPASTPTATSGSSTTRSSSSSTSRSAATGPVAPTPPRPSRRRWSSTTYAPPAAPPPPHARYAASAACAST